jgi:hypothetical protein
MIVGQSRRVTVWPRKSMTLVFGPASFLIAALVPTAVNLPLANRHRFGESRNARRRY